MTDKTTETIQSDKDALANGATSGELWLKKIERAQKDEEEWRKEAKEAVEAYEASSSESPITFNIFHSNIETLIPALYNSSPVPDVRRRFGDADPVAKQVVDMEERALSYSIDQYDVDEVFIAAIRDAACTGRGVVEIEYTPHENGYQELTSKRVPWDKFIRGPGRSWDVLPWAGTELDLTKDELAKINPDKAKAVDLGEKSDAEKDRDTSKDPKGILKTTKMYKIWDKASRKVIFVDDKKQIWNTIDDPLQLPGFFPYLTPLQPAQRPSSLVPVCQFKVYKPLLDELDTTTKRISRLIKQLKVRGLIDGEMAADFELLKSCEDGQYVAAKNASTFAGQGGLEKGIAHWPLEQIIKAIEELRLHRDSIIQKIYEVTGIADIMRGASDPNETLGAQQIKQQWGSLRVQRQQGKIAHMARELFRAKVCLFSKHFSDQNMQLMTSLPSPENQEQQQIWPQVMKLFREDIRGFRVDIETDSTIRADMTRNQEQMNQFLAGTGKFASAMTGVVEVPGMQAAVPVMVEVYTAFARKFKLGKQAEDALDKLSVMAQQMAQQPQEEQPDPEAEKLKMEMEAAKQKNQLDMQAMQAKTQNDAMAMQMKAQHDERMMQLAEQKAAMEIELKQVELQMKREEIALKAEAAKQDAEMKSQERAEDFAYGQAERRENANMMHETNEAKRQGMADKAKFDKQRHKQQQSRPRA